MVGLECNAANLTVESGDDTRFLSFCFMCFSTAFVVEMLRSLSLGGCTVVFFVIEFAETTPGLLGMGGGENCTLFEFVELLYGVSRRDFPSRQ